MSHSLHNIPRAVFIPFVSHSTGRGGRANITPLHEPPIEHHEHPAPHYESTGRGGAGNIVRDRSKSKPRA